MARPAAETLILLFGGVVAVVLVLEAVAVVLVAILHPGADLDLDALQAQMQILLGALLGYATGRSIRTPPDQ